MSEVNTGTLKSRVIELVEDHAKLAPPMQSFYQMPTSTTHTWTNLASFTRPWSAHHEL